MINLTLGMWAVVILTVLACGFAMVHVIEKVAEIDLTPQHPQAKHNKIKLVLLTSAIPAIGFLAYWFMNLIVFGNIKIKI